MRDLLRSPRRLVGAAIAAVVVTALVAIALLKSTPDVYRRTESLGADEAAVARFNEEVVNKVGNVLLDKSGGTLLELQITERMANGRLARLIEDQERAGRRVPQVLRDARIGFEPGRMVLATRIGSGASSVVVCQDLRLVVEPGGQLRIEPAGLAAGVLPLPGGVMGEIRRTVAGHLERLVAARADKDTVDIWCTGLDALEGKPIPVGKGKNRILLERIDVERGILKVLGHRARDARREPTSQPATEAQEIPPVPPSPGD